MALAELQVTQAGAAITLASDCTGSLSSANAGGGLSSLITITATMNGGVLPSECTFTLTVRDVPLLTADDTTSFVSLVQFAAPNTNKWSLTLKAACWGALVLELRVSRNGVVDTTTRRYDFPSPNKALVMPGNAEIIDARAANASYGGSINRASWSNLSNSAEPRGYAKAWRTALSALDVAGTATLNTLSFFARRGTGASGTITSAQAYQEILGHGIQSYTLAHFGWTGGDVGVAFQAAVDAACVTGGDVLLPTGFLACDREIVVTPPAVGPGGSEQSVRIRGAGESGTVLFFHAGTNGIRLAGNASSGGRYLNQPYVSDLSIQMNNGALGLVLHETLFASVMNVRVFGCTDTAVSIIDSDGGVNAFACMNTYMSRVTGALSARGFHIGQCLQATFVGCISNQNAKGWHIEQCNGVSIVGGMWQDTWPMHIDPAGLSTIQLTILGKIYVENATNVVIQVDRAPVGAGYIGNINILGGMTVQNGGVPGQAVLDLNDCALHVGAGAIDAQAWTTLIRARTMDSAIITGGPTDPARLDFDAASLARTTFLGAGGAAIGTALTGTTGATATLALGVPLKLKSWTTGTRPTVAGMGYNSTLSRMEFSLDGSTWKQLAVDP